MSKIRIGCETYTWQMPGEQYKGRLEHIMGIVSHTGFEGIEPETSFFGHLSDPVLMKETLEKHQLELAVLCHVEDWRYPTETESEKVNAGQWMDFLQHFPETTYLLVQMPGKDRADLEARQQNLLTCVNAVARRAYDRGITCSYHPNSPEGSIYRTAEDYKILLGGLNHDHIGYCPDAGHIAKGGMDPLEVIKQYREFVNLVHYKDMHANGNWALTGEGIIDFRSITKYLIDTNYEGWIIMEDEDDRAIKDPDGVTLQDGEYIRASIKPMFH